MAERGAPLGNTNGAKGKIVGDALRKAAADNDYRRLRKGCEKLMDAFAEGEPWAISLVFDRLDGKPAQQVNLADNEGKPLTLGLVAYAAELRSGHTVQVQPEALPAPDTAGS